MRTGSHAAIVRALTPDRDVSLRSVPIPAGTMAVSMRTQLRGEPLSLALVLRDKRGRDQPRAARHRTCRELDADGTPAARGGRCARARDRADAGRARRLLHLYNEGRLVRAPSGVVSLGRLTMADGDAITNWVDWVPRGQTATIRGRYATRLRVAYAFEEAETLRLRPRQPTDGYALPVLASPAVAAAAGPGGLVTLDYLTNQVEGRVVAVARRFPTMGEDEQFAVVDEDALQTALTVDAPGTGTPGEVWLSVPASQRDRTRLALARRPFAQLERTSRETLYRQAHDDPLARGVAVVLGAAALAAILLAVVGLWATVLSDLRDERDTFFDLEVQGASPAALRAHLRLRALCLLAFGVVGGAILGFLLSRLVASVVQVTGGATDPFPPLVLDWGARPVVAALCLLVALSVVVVEATVRGAFRAEAPERDLMELRVTPAVSVRDAFRIYGDGPRAAVALQGLTLDVAEGEIVAVLGPSGSGKTTLLRLVAGLEQLSAGSVHAFGIDIGRLTRRQRGAYRAEQLGFLDQHYTRALSPELRVRDAVSLQLELRGVPTSEAGRRAKDSWRASASGIAATTCRERSREASNSVWPSAPRSLTARGCCSSTSLQASSTATAQTVYDSLGGGRTCRRRRCARRQPRCGGGLDRRPARPRARRPRRRGGRARRGAGARGVGGRVGPAAGRLWAGARNGRARRSESSAGDCAPTTVPSLPNRCPSSRRRRERSWPSSRGVTKAYNGHAVLSKLDLSVRRSRLTAVVGRSGSGKTTLLHLLAGLVRPTAGDVVVSGMAFDERSRSALADLRRQTIAVVTQEPGLVPHLSARENVLLGLGLRRNGTHLDGADDALDIVGLAELRGRRAADALGGRAATCRNRPRARCEDASPSRR